jgi:hypothetical protein
MSDNLPPEDELPFSEDPEEQMRIENELLKLKMQAEMGASFFEMESLPADLERKFLEKVMTFDEDYANLPEKKVWDILERPKFTPSSEIEDLKMDAYLSEVEFFLRKKNIIVDFICSYPARRRYEFITQELMSHEVLFLPMPDNMLHFTYEDFHPNHKYDIERTTRDFMANWFDQSFNDDSVILGVEFYLPGNEVMLRNELLKKFRLIFESYVGFENEEFKPGSISFTLEGKFPQGQSNGVVSYDARLENGEIIHFEGRYILYMQNLFGFWQVSYFEFPGFKW